MEERLGENCSHTSFFLALNLHMVTDTFMTKLVTTIPQTPKIQVSVDRLPVTADLCAGVCVRRRKGKVTGWHFIYLRIAKPQQECTGRLESQLRTPLLGEYKSHELSNWPSGAFS